MDTISNSAGCPSSSTDIVTFPHSWASAAGHQDLSVLILNSSVERSIRTGPVWRKTLLGALWASSNPGFCDLLKYKWSLCIFLCVWYLAFQERLIWVTGWGNKPSMNARLWFCNRFLGSHIISGFYSAGSDLGWGFSLFFIFCWAFKNLFIFLPCAENQVKGKCDNLRNRAL